MRQTVTTLAALAALLSAGVAYASPEEDRSTVAALDTAYQAAVERNDAEAMGAILHPDMILVVGRGTVITREELLEAARAQSYVYEHQVEDEGTQVVRLYGRGHCYRDGAAVAEGHAQWRGVRSPAVVQRHLCAHAGGLALRVRAILDQPAAAAIGVAAGVSLRLKVSSSSHRLSRH